MKQFWQFGAVLLGPGVVLFLALVGYAAVDVYVRGNCDPKFGCAGSVQLAAFIAGLALLCSSLGHLPACLIFRNSVRHLRTRWLLGVVTVLSLGQGALFASSGELLPGDSLTSMIGAWAVISALVALAVPAVVRRWSPNNSFKPTPLRGAA